MARKIKKERTEEWQGRKLRAPSGCRAAVQGATGQPNRRPERKDGTMERQDAYRALSGNRARNKREPSGAERARSGAQSAEWALSGAAMGHGTAKEKARKKDGRMA